MFDLKNIRILYMGTPKISADALALLLDHGVNIVGVIAQVDKEVGRKKIKEPVPTKVVALAHNIPVFQPTKIRDDYSFVYDLKPDLILTFAYGQIIPQGLLDIPVHGALNLHGSLLPKYRGAAPIQRAIMNGEKESGITLMKMVAKMDAGTMYAKEVVPILADDNYTSLANKLSLAAVKVFLENIEGYYLGTNKGVEQNESEVTFANKINSEDEHLNLNLNKIEQINYIRALSETPGAYLLLNQEKMKIYQAKIYSDEIKGPVGTIFAFNRRFLYQAKDGLIELLIIKPANKKLMRASDYLNGHTDLVNKIFQ